MTRTEKCGSTEGELSHTGRWEGVNMVLSISGRGEATSFTENNKNRKKFPANLLEARRETIPNKEYKLFKQTNKTPKVLFALYTFGEPGPRST